LKLKLVAKPLFATNCTDFREVEKKSAQISEISGKDFEVLGIVANLGYLHNNIGSRKRLPIL
jgi:hypothetical protein